MSFFSVHPSSASATLKLVIDFDTSAQNNTLVGSDNRGMAAYLYESDAKRQAPWLSNHLLSDG